MALAFWTKVESLDIGVPRLTSRTGTELGRCLLTVKHFHLRGCLPEHQEEEAVRELLNGLSARENQVGHLCYTLLSFRSVRSGLRRGPREWILHWWQVNDSNITWTVPFTHPSTWSMRLTGRKHRFSRLRYDLAGNRTSFGGTCPSSLTTYPQQPLVIIITTRVAESVSESQGVGGFRVESEILGWSRIRNNTRSRCRSRIFFVWLRLRKSN